MSWIGAILAVFVILEFFGVSPTKDSSEKPALFQKEEPLSILTNDDASFDEQIFLGGPLAALIGSDALASIDFSADDDLENSDLSLLQENSLISPTNPTGTANFPGYNREILNYIVKQGDTPEQIAASFGINTDTLLWANGLRDGDIIRPNQELLILPINGVRIKVGAKDTVESLAKKYNGGVMEIIAFNELTLDGKLQAGGYVVIPGGEMPVSAAAPKITPGKKYAKSTTPASTWLIWPASGKNWGRLHNNNAVDIASPCGTPVYAAAAGKVVISDGVGYNGGYGKYIKILHPNGVSTLYAHASSLLVNIGEQVAQGQQIMVMGTTGRSTGCHVHFEVRGASNPLVKR